MGTELLIGLALAFVVLGPERMHSMLGHLGKAKAQFDNASKEIRDQLTSNARTLPGAGSAPSLDPHTTLVVPDRNATNGAGGPAVL